MKTTEKRGYKYLEQTDKPDLTLYGESLKQVDTDVDKLFSQNNDFAQILSGISPTQQGYTNWHSGNIPIEVGTWTPSLIGSTVAGANQLNSSQSPGYYYRVGKFVHIAFSVVLQTKDTSMSGYILIAGLPFAANGDYHMAQQIINLRHVQNLNANSIATFYGGINNGATKIAINAKSVGSDYTTLDSSLVKNGTIIAGSGIYVI